MTKFKELIAEHQELQKQLSEQPDSVDVERVEPMVQQARKAIWPFGLIPEIDDKELAIEFEVVERGIECALPGGYHRQGIRKENDIKGVRQAKGVKVIEVFGQTVAQHDAVAVAFAMD